MTNKSFKWVHWFSQIGMSDFPRVGKKNASLGEMYRELRPTGVMVPNGFALSVNAFHHYLEDNLLKLPLEELLKDFNPFNSEDLAQRAHRARSLILAAHWPRDIERELVEAYEQLEELEGGTIEVAVRGSATAEDRPEASFAGQQETYLNVRGQLQLLDACKRCLASLFTDRAISYRHGLGIAHTRVGLSIGVQRMVRSDLGSAGVMFTVDTETGFPNLVLIHASFGLGETVAQGSVSPDEYYVFKPTLRLGHNSILKKNLGSKEFKLVYDIGGGKMVKPIPVPNQDRRRFALSDEDILKLARWAVTIEDYHNEQYEMRFPMEIEWAKDGRTGELFILQARPEEFPSSQASQASQASQDTSDLPRPETEIMLNISDPSEALRLSQVPNDGVGLARQDLILNDLIGIHPMALIHPEKTQAEDLERIMELTSSHPDKTRFFIDKLAEGVGLIAAAFYPKDVILRLSDLKSNEYARLLGGQTFETQEKNPLIGLRGASRYCHPGFKEAFSLECQALVKARRELGLKNLKVMVPFCRTISEAKKVLEEMSSSGLIKGDDGFEVYLLCEVPGNIILADQFSELFDGFYIDSDDLTQLVLGVDRRSETISDLFDELDPAVRSMISQAIGALKKKRKRIGVCIQNPDDHEDFIQFLIGEGVDSISVEPGSLKRALQIAYRTETTRNAVSSKPQIGVTPKEISSPPSN